MMVVLSGASTATKRRKRGMATGTAWITWVTATAKTCSKQAAVAAVKRCCRAWGVIVIPTRAANWVNCCSVAAGSASQPKTKVCTKPAPVSLERGCTQPVCRATVSAVVVNSVRIVRATCGMVVIGETPGCGYVTTGSPGPNLVQSGLTRWQGAQQLSGFWEPPSMTTHALPRSWWTVGQLVCHIWVATGDYHP